MTTSPPSEIIDETIGRDVFGCKYSVRYNIWQRKNFYVVECYLFDSFGGNTGGYTGVSQNKDKHAAMKRAEMRLLEKLDISEIEWVDGVIVIAQQRHKTKQLSVKESRSG